MSCPCKKPAFAQTGRRSGLESSTPLVLCSSELLKFCFSFPVFLERLHPPVLMPPNCLSFLVRKSTGMLCSLRRSLLASLCLLELLWLDPLDNGNWIPLMDVNHTCEPGLHLPVRQGRPPACSSSSQGAASPSKGTLQTKSRSAQDSLATGGLYLPSLG